LCPTIASGFLKFFIDFADQAMISARTRNILMSYSQSVTRHNVVELLTFVERLVRHAGCDGDKPTMIARGLIEADLLGHTTHGLQLAAAYLKELESGAMLATGEVEVIADRPAAVTWDGRMLPGVWLTTNAVDLAAERASVYGQATVVIRRSHHIACLAAFLQRATDRGLMCIIASSDPAAASVAPFGGRRAVVTPNPLAVGIPTAGDPILIDISASITTNGMAARLHREGKQFPGEWALNADGQPTNDPATQFTTPPGTLLPTGGRDHGHKGYGWALMIEALTQGLSGFGRAEGPKGWGASVFVQVFDPALFGGHEAFVRETTWLTEQCRSCPPVPGVDAVRLPGQRALERKRRAIAEGVELYPGILASLEPWANKWAIPKPQPITS
jgi:LDH2 family malate/lactate/ureidoglycolate dehydrogenase